MDIQFIETRKLIPYENNPRRNDTAVDAVANSIKSFGFKSPIIVDNNMVVICGHTRLKAAKKLKLKVVPCVIANDLTEEQVKAYRLADNKVGEVAEWDDALLKIEFDGIIDIDMSDFGFDLELDDDSVEDFRDPSCQHNVFENQERMQFPTDNYYGIPVMEATQTVGDKFLRFMDYNLLEDHSQHIAHFYYDDYKFIEAWRDPDKYLDKLRQFKAVVSPDFSLYTDFPRALQILSCYRRQWCGAYWQSLGLDVIPDIAWGDEESFNYCFDGIPERSVVAVSSVGVKGNKEAEVLFKAGYDEMLNRLKPTKVLYYGDMIDGLDGDIIQIPSYYAEKREYLNKKKRTKKNGSGS